MKRLVLITGLMIVLLLVLHVPVTYAKERTGHDSDMEQVFFGDVKAGSGQKKVAKTLEAAAYLTIDLSFNNIFFVLVKNMQSSGDKSNVLTNRTFGIYRLYFVYSRLFSRDVIVIIRS